MDKEIEIFKHLTKMTCGSIESIATSLLAHIPYQDPETYDRVYQIYELLLAVQSREVGNWPIPTEYLHVLDELQKASKTLSNKKVAKIMRYLNDKEASPEN